MEPESMVLDPEFIEVMGWVEPVSMVWEPVSKEISYGWSQCLWFRSQCINKMHSRHSFFLEGSQLWAFISMVLLGENQKFLCSSDWKFHEFFKTYPTIIWGVPKNQGFLVKCPYQALEESRDKSWVSFERFRKFPVQLAQKRCIFIQKLLRYKGLNLATLTMKYCIWLPSKLSLCKIISFW